MSIPSSHVVQVARYLGVVDRRAHDVNSKHRILSTCRAYLAKRSTDKAVFHSFAQFEDTQH